MKRVLVALVALALILAGCSDEDDSAPSNGNTGTTQNPGDTGDAAGDSDASASGAIATASVDIGGIAYEFSGATDCSPSGIAGLSIRFDDGDDFVSLNQSGDVILIRARLGGTE
jgi:hypothetical protein